MFDDRYGIYEDAAISLSGASGASGAAGTGGASGVDGASGCSESQAIREMRMGNMAGSMEGESRQS